VTAREAPPRYRCSRCERSYGLDETVWRCECGGPLGLDPGPGLDRSEVDGTGPSGPSLRRYRRAFVVPAIESAVRFEEGATPLVQGDWAGSSLLFKLDFLFPSGSYKDRGFAVLASHLRRIGVRKVFVDSSGNAGASLAGYSAALDLDCTVYIPGGTPSGKVTQIQGYGAELVPVPGPRQAAADAAMAAAGEGFYASHNWSPLFLEGVKSLAYELWEQLGHRAPDAVFAPVGYGSVVLSLDRGFRELKRAGSIASLPRLYGCQAEACAPLHRAYVAGDLGATSLPADEVGVTIAEGVASSAPVRSREILEAVRRSSGAIVAVDEDEILEALRKLHGRGLYVEPTSAVAGAGASRVLGGGQRAPPVGKSVVVLTGSGLKATDKLARLQEPTEPEGEEEGR